MPESNQFLPGARFLTLIMEFPTIEEGTSASTPVFAAMVSLMNDARLNNKKSPLGFLVSPVHCNCI